LKNVYKALIKHSSAYVGQQIYYFLFCFVIQHLSFITCVYDSKYLNLTVTGMLDKFNRFFLQSNSALDVENHIQLCRVIAHKLAHKRPLGGQCSGVQQVESKKKKLMSEKYLAIIVLTLSVGHFGRTQHWSNHKEWEWMRYKLTINT